APGRRTHPLVGRRAGRAAGSPAHPPCADDARSLASRRGARAVCGRVVPLDTGAADDGTAVSEVLKRLRAWLRPVRRPAIVGPMIEAVQLRAVLRHIAGSPMHVRVLGPDELAPYVRNLTLLSPDRPAFDARPYDCVVVRQDHLGALDRRLLAALEGFGCAYA